MTCATSGSAKDTARKVFGVVVKDALERSLDVAATEKLRAELRRNEAPDDRAHHAGGRHLDAAEYAPR